MGLPMSPSPMNPMVSSMRRSIRGRFAGVAGARTRRSKVSGSMARSGPRWRDPLVAVMAVLVAFALRWWLRPVVGDTGVPLQMFYLAVFVAAWAGGLATGLLATFSSLVLAVAAFFAHPNGLLSLALPDVIAVAVFLVIGVVFSVMSESRLVALEREAAQREQLLSEQAARAAALTAVAEQREQLQRVADHVPVILASCGLDRRFRFVNQANAARFGLKPADMVGRSIDELLGPETAAELEPYIDRVLAGERVEYEMTYTFPLTGRQRMQCTYVPERSADGTVIGWIAALVNVTPIRQVEADVKNLAFLIQNTSDVVVMSDLGLTPIYANEAATRLSGLPSTGSTQRIAARSVRRRRSGRGRARGAPASAAERCRGDRDTASRARAPATQSGWAAPSSCSATRTVNRPATASSAAI